MISVVILVITILLFTLKYLFPIFQVVGDSMYPTYFDGEILIGTRLFRKSKLKPNDVVLYRCPTDTNKVVIKRVSNVRSCGKGKVDIYCLGDNAKHSYDSRRYGYVQDFYIVCKVIDQRRNTNHDGEEE